MAGRYPSYKVDVGFGLAAQAVAQRIEVTGIKEIVENNSTA